MLDAENIFKGVCSSPHDLVYIFGLLLAYSYLYGLFLVLVMYVLFHNDKAYVENELLALLIGIVERFIYSFAIIFNAYELITAWIAIKLCAHFCYRKGADGSKREKVEYYTHTVGSGLSIVGGIACAVLVLYFMEIVK